MGMYLMRQIGTRGVYGNAELPDFMVFLNWTELPWYWYGFNQFWFAALMVLLVPGLLAYLFGFFAFRSRVSGVHLSIITQALTFALMLAFFRNDMGFGGNNGLTDFKDILGFNLQAGSTRAALFAATCFALAAKSRPLPFHHPLAARHGDDGDPRCRKPHALSWLSGRSRSSSSPSRSRPVSPGSPGRSMCPQVGIINPSEFAPANSIEAVIWAAVGGRGTLFGPIIGAIVVNFAKSWFTSVLPEVWLFALGGLFLAVTLFLPQGLAGLFTSGHARAAAPAMPAAQPEAAE